MSNNVYTAKQILDTYWDKKLPVDVDKLCKDMGLVILEKPTDTFIGSIERENNFKYIITVAGHLPSVKRRFLIAHLIGCFCLQYLDVSYCKHIVQDKDLMTDVSIIYRQCNNFALKLLIDESVLRFAILERNYRTTESLARCFNVSEVAMSVRLKQLKIIN